MLSSDKSESCYIIIFTVCIELWVFNRLYNKLILIYRNLTPRSERFYLHFGGIPINRVFRLRCSSNLINISEVSQTASDESDGVGRLMHAICFYFIRTKKTGDPSPVLSSIVDCVNRFLFHQHHFHSFLKVGSFNLIEVYTGSGFSSMIVCSIPLYCIITGFLVFVY